MSKRNSEENILRRTINTKREFNYSKGNCNLGFTLNVDVKKELKDFKDCLIQALSDVEKTIDNIG